jgi:hypothetical protein
MLPVLMYKFARNYDYSYVLNALYAHTKNNYWNGHYEAYISPIRETFYESVVLLAINVIGFPTFSEIVGNLHISPSMVSKALSGLHHSNKIFKSGGIYHTHSGYDDDAFGAFSTTEISKLRSYRMAVA